MPVVALLGFIRSHVPGRLARLVQMALEDLREEVRELIPARDVGGSAAISSDTVTAQT